MSPPRKDPYIESMFSMVRNPSGAERDLRGGLPIECWVEEAYKPKHPKIYEWERQI